MNLTDANVQEKLAHAGELMIRAAAVLGTLSKEELELLRQRTDGSLPDALGWAIAGAAQLSAQVAQSLKQHPPRGLDLPSSALASWYVPGPNVAPFVCTRLIAEGVTFKCELVAGGGSDQWYRFSMDPADADRARPPIAQDQPSFASDEDSPRPAGER